MGNQRLCLLGQPSPLGARDGKPKGLSGILAEPGGGLSPKAPEALAPSLERPKMLSLEGLPHPRHPHPSVLWKEPLQLWKGKQMRGKRNGVEKTKKKKLAHSSHKGRRES